MKRASGKRSIISVWTRVDPEGSPSRYYIVQSSILGIVNILPLALHSSIRAFIAAITLSMPFSFHPCIQALFCHLRPGLLAYVHAVKAAPDTMITPTTTLTAKAPTPTISNIFVTLCLSYRLLCSFVVVVSVCIDSHSSKPCFSVQFVDTYSIRSFPPP